MTDINKQVNKSRRIFELDIARVICMYLVVFGHLYSYDGGSPIRVWIYSFHMALFFFVSGILHKERVSIYKRYCKYIYNYDTYRNNYLDNVSELRHVPSSQEIKRIH